MGLAVTMLVSPGKFLTNLSGTGGSVGEGRLSGLQGVPILQHVKTGSGLN